jgi:phage terminase large subunit
LRRQSAQEIDIPNAPIFRGSALEIQSLIDGKGSFETIISGPAETGKTFAALWLVDSCLRKYPNAQAVLARKIRDTILPSVLQTYIKIINRRGGVTVYGGKRPEWYDYSNGSRLWLAGIDDAGKALSSERDIIYVNQAEDLTIDDWETLTTRATGRAGNVQHSFILGDCNPSSERHWIKQRKSLRLLKSFHIDNPSLYDDSDVITAQGEKTLSILNDLSGVRRKRLLDGQWVTPEGAIYGDYFDSSVNCVSVTIRSDWARFRVIDFGYTNPFVCKWYALDHDGRIHCYRELYQTQLLVEDAAQLIKHYSGEYDTECLDWLDARGIRERYPKEHIVCTIADHDAEDRATLERHGVSTIPAVKYVKLGIEALQKRFVPAGDGKPRFYYVSNTLVAIDDRLVKAHKPTCTLEEIDGYVWELAKDGKPLKEQPVKLNDHGLDCDRYAVCFVDNVGAELVDHTEVITYENDYVISPY